MAHKRCLHGLDPPESCAYCFPKGGKKSAVTHTTIPQDSLDIDERDLYGVPKNEDEDGDDDLEPAEAAFHTRRQKARRPLWDLRVSDKPSVSSSAPKTPKPPRLLPSLTQDEGEKDKKHAPISEDNPMAIARRLEQLRSNKRTLRDIAATFNASDAWVSQHLSLLKLIPKVQELMDPARLKSTRLNFTVAVALASLPPYLQEKCAQEVLLRRWTANEAARYVRMRAQQERVSAQNLSRPAG